MLSNGVCLLINDNFDKTACCVNGPGVTLVRMMWRWASELEREDHQVGGHPNSGHENSVRSVSWYWLPLTGLIPSAQIRLLWWYTETWGVRLDTPPQGHSIVYMLMMKQHKKRIDRWFKRRGLPLLLEQHKARTVQRRLRMRHITSCQWRVLQHS